MSARELSLLARVAHGHVSLLETGERRFPRGETIQRIASVLGVSVEWLLTGDGSEPTAESVASSVSVARERAASTTGNAA